MEIPYNPPKEEDGIVCPECGSTKVGVNEDVEVKSKPDDRVLKQYTCGDCKCVFIPAMMEETTPMDAWARKLRLNENMNTKSWKKSKNYIVIKKKDK